MGEKTLNASICSIKECRLEERLVGMVNEMGLVCRRRKLNVNVNRSRVSKVLILESLGH